ncbi:MAG: hypothetical protein RL038_1196 [Actinomycetota bacterium]
MGVREWVNKFTAGSAELDAAELRDGVLSAGADPICELESGQITTLTGIVNSLIFRPENAVPVFEVELFDGSGTVILKFMGRRQIRGIVPGTSMVVTGRIVRCDSIMTMFNPEYRLLPRAEAI